MHLTLGRSRQNAPTVEAERITNWFLGHVYFLGVMLAQKRWVLCLYHRNSKARKQIWILKCLRTPTFLKCEIQAWRQSSYQAPGGGPESSHMQVQKGAFVSVPLNSKKAVFISGWSADCMWGHGVHRVHEGGGLGMLFPFISPLERRKIL